MHEDMNDKNWSMFEGQKMTGRNRRLLTEWTLLDKALAQRPDIEYQITRRNAMGLPIGYLITYHIRSICGVTNQQELNMNGITNEPIFATVFYMQINIPEGYPCIDAPVDYHFLCKDQEGKDILHPWHPNIRYFGEFAGRVCLNSLNTFTSLAWGVDRVGLYLRYELYHAWQEPPYPEDPKVAEWVIKQGEPKEWIFFDQDL